MLVRLATNRVNVQASFAYVKLFANYVHDAILTCHELLKLV